MVFLSNPWLAIVVPAVIALTVAVFGRLLGRLVPWVTAFGPVVVLAEGIAGLVAIADPGRLPLTANAVRGEPWVGGVAFHGWFTWLSQGGKSITLGWALDGLGAVMLCVVGGVSLMVVLFSIGYMRGEKALSRYFALIALFVSAMCGLVLSDGLVGLFISWELMGVCSYLLIGFWFQRPEASKAAVKAFLVTRIGDTGLLAGLALLWTSTGSLAFSEVLEKVPSLPATVVTGAALLLFLGAVGKSAQFPLHVWLPDAMAGPTPVSALIHAATMVAAGVFLIARTWPLFEASESALGIILAVGVITALGAAIVAGPQNDIKRVLAYSTVSQLGFMFAALGAGHWPVALFHLVTHAAFKALLFLTSGSLIHACGTQDVRDMGGLVRKMPVTSMAWLVGVAALAGVPPLSGFVSKDGVLHAVLSADKIAGGALLIAAAFTAFYSYRVTRLALFGDYRGTSHPHEGGPVMVLPLLTLAGFAALLGFVQPMFYTVWAEHAEGVSAPVALLAVGAMLLGGISAAYVYRRGTSGDDTMRDLIGLRWELARSGFHVDALYKKTVTKPTVRLAQVLYSGVDRSLVDRVVELTAPLSHGAARVVSRLQSGDARSYSMLIGAAVVAALAFVVWAGR